MKRLYAMLAFLFTMTVMLPASANGLFLTAGAAVVDGSEAVNSDVMVAVEAGVENELIRVGAHVMRDAGTKRTFTTTDSKYFSLFEEDVTTTQLSKYKTYGVCGSLHKNMGGFDPAIGACYGRHDYGFRDEEAFSLRGGAALALNKTFSVNADYLHDFTDDEQARIMLSVSGRF